MQKTRKGLAAIPAALVMVVVWAQAAYAQTAGPLDGVKTQSNQAKADLVDFVTTVGIPIMFTLAILGLGIALAVRYLQKARRNA
jgi:ABC-type Fe3+-siderophore transport system permease subunit